MEGAEGRRNRHRKECMTKAAVSLTIPPLLLCTKNKLEIRSRPLLEPGSDYHDSVPAMGLEPIRCCHRQILSLVRLPFRHAGLLSFHRITASLKQKLFYHNLTLIASLILAFFMK